MKQDNKGDKPRLIAPGSNLLKCVDGRWTDTDGLTPTGEMLAVGTTRGLQRFNGKGEPPDEIPERDRRLTQDDADALNAKIPVEEWRDGLNGEPDPPWKLVHIAHLLDTDTATRYTFINSTTGARIAVERLERRMEDMWALRGAGIRPIVKLDSRPMNTKVPGVTKQRPEFTIIEFRDFGDGDGGNRLLGPSRGGGGGGAPLIEHQVNPAPTPPATPTKPTPAAPMESATPAKKKVGKDVRPVTISEEINDSLPDDLAPPPINPLKAG